MAGKAEGKTSAFFISDLKESKTDLSFELFYENI
ncbi:hypothetical protein BH23BAC1_BH23BAC1_22700 [soil metagenome]